MERRAWGGYETLRKPPTTRSTGRPRSASGACSSKTKNEPRFGGAFSMLRKCQNTPRTNLMQFSIHLVYILELAGLGEGKGKAPQPLWL